MNVFRDQEVYHINRHEEITLEAGEIPSSVLNDMEEVSPLPSGSPIEDIESWNYVEDNYYWYYFIVALDEDGNVFLTCLSFPEDDESATKVLDNQLILTNVMKMTEERVFLTYDGLLSVLDIHNYHDGTFDFDVKDLPSQGAVVNFDTVFYDEILHTFVVLNNGDLYVIIYRGDGRLPPLEVRRMTKVGDFNVLQTNFDDVLKVKVSSTAIAILREGDVLEIVTSGSRRRTKNSIIDIGVIGLDIVVLREDGLIGISSYSSQYQITWKEEWGTGFSFRPRHSRVTSAGSYLH